MELPIPIFTSESIYSGVTLKKPSPAVIADTYKVVSDGNYYFGIQTFLAGCISELIPLTGDSVSDRSKVRQVVANMPFRSADWLAIQAMLLLEPNDGIEGVYTCPRCHKQVICEVKESLGIDNRDFISQLEVRKMEVPENEFEVELGEPIELNVGDIQDVIKTMTFRNPTLGDCNRAYSSIGDKDRVRFQLYVFVEALEKINGKPADKVFKKRYGMMMFEKMDLSRDVGSITKVLNQYGIETRVEKHCPGCGKEWKAEVNTANFFVSGLRQD